ncbi:metallophosphoesterase family protein [Actinomadura macrotermitis]|uniref:3',5'-cyclic adenosine monophosphate phosphodiesterase CpdA n=1 Tax=Actinomadura macrotermitis TaxID=2585200 RepID=A0A7K0BTT5_9ACTN|nr:metallophosphoesterase [Actinomadura macrotermitis]MQY04579.1 3',5'-cyclic adenosine monophosphate phosphodiesterase CpdA [Actinomadura macrotermitis]
MLDRTRKRLTGPRARLGYRVLAVVAVGLLGGLAGLLLGGRVDTPVGPSDVTLSLRPSWTGGTQVRIPPLGSLRLDTHTGPIALQAQLSELHLGPTRALIEKPAEMDRLTEQVTTELWHGIVQMMVRAVALALAAAFLAGLTVFRSWRRALLSAGTALAGMLAVSLTAWLTFNANALAEPRYTGLLANAPQVVGDTRNVVERFTAYRAQLAHLVGNVSRLYAATSTLPAYEPDPSTLRVLHVSDIHLNPAAWNVIRSVGAQFQVDMIIDTGDLMDHGTRAEDAFAKDISSLKVPYVYIRGNHDSRGTQAAVARQKNAIVLDDATRAVEGLRIYGVGDPRYTPDKKTRGDDVTVEQMHATGVGLADRLRASGTAPDVIAVHDPAEAQAFTGRAPLILAGHAHKRDTKLLPTGSRLFVQGSTGGAGARGLEHEEPTPIELSVLYFSRATHRLQGWDDLRLGGLGLTSAQIERHLEPKPDRPVTPPEQPGPSPQQQTPSTTPATSASPSRDRPGG